MGVELDLIFVNISRQLFCSEDLGNLHELIVIVFALEEWLLLEDHAGEHAAEGPYV